MQNQPYITKGKNSKDPRAASFYAVTVPIYNKLKNNNQGYLGVVRKVVSG
jgi:hypothetical protein